MSMGYSIFVIPGDGQPSNQDNYMHGGSSMQTTIANLKAQNAKLSSELAAAIQSLNACRANDCRDGLAKLNAQLAACNAKLHDFGIVSQNLSVCKKDIITFKSDLDACKQRSSLLISENNSYKIKISEGEKSVLLLNTQISSLKMEITTSQNALADAKTQIATLRQNAAGFNNQILDCKAKLDEAVNLNSRLTSDFAQCKKDVVDFKAQVEELKKEIFSFTKIRKDCDNLSIEYNNLISTSNNLKSIIAVFHQNFSSFGLSFKQLRDFAKRMGTRVSFKTCTSDREKFSSMFSVCDRSMQTIENHMSGWNKFDFNGDAHDAMDLKTCVHRLNTQLKMFATQTSTYEDTMKKYNECMSSKNEDSNVGVILGNSLE